MTTYKLFSISFLIIALIISAAVTNAQSISSSIAPLYDGPNWGTITDTGITCSGGPLVNIIRDDGSYENGYRSTSTGDSTTMVQKMVMPTMNFTISQVCVVWTALAPSGNLTFDIMIYDTTGPGGTPGNLLYRTNNKVANNVAIYPGHSRYSYPIFYITSQRAYYVGVRWNNNPVLPFFFSADENGPVSNMGPGYLRITTSYPPLWQESNIVYPVWKSFGVRLEGNANYPYMGTQVTICRGGLNIPINDHMNTLDSIFAPIGDDIIVLDVNVKLDTVLHTWDSDLSFYLKNNNKSVKIINRAGGSGDNFIGTILNDSAVTSIESGTAPFTGSFSPSNPLTAFIGNPGINGRYWKLLITDTATGDTGFLKRWCIVLTYMAPVGGIQTVEIPNYYSLSQNYPNPFNPVTTIKYTLPEAENVKLVLFDVLGREVKTLVNEFKVQGVYELSFDASSLSSGVYFYRLEAGDYSAIKKMLIVK